MSKNLRALETTILGLALIGLFLPAFAQSPDDPVPTMMNYQGRLTDNTPEQNPITANLPMNFKLFDSLTNGNVIWSEFRTGVSVVNGIFSVLLGEVAPMPAEVFYDYGSTLYLEVEIDGQLLLPRQQLASVGWAMKAQHSVSSNDVLCTGCVGPSDIAANAVGTLRIQDESILTQDILDGTISGNDIQNGAIAGSHIQGETLTTSHILDGSIGSADIADSAIAGSHVQSETLTTSHILDGSIGSADIGSNTIAGSQIIDGTITGADIATGAITTTDILDGTVSGTDIQNSTITSADIYNGTITSADIQDGTITHYDIEDGTITGQEIFNGSIGANDIGTSAMNTNHILNGTITEDDLGFASLFWSAELPNSSTTEANLYLGAHNFCALAKYNLQNPFNSGTNIFCRVYKSGSTWLLGVRGNGTTTLKCSAVCF